MNARAFEVPDSVVIVTVVEDGDPGTLGTVTVHRVCTGQLVGAAVASKRATIRPFGLTNPLPEITMD